MQQVIHDTLSSYLKTELKQIQPISGGDIAEAFVVHTSTDHFFVKHQKGKQALAILKAEQLGLETIAATNTIAAPQVFDCISYDHGALLLLEYITPKAATASNFSRLGEELAALHHSHSTSFGFTQDNFIGSLPQSNTKHDNWTSFYVQKRLMPQLLLAQSKGLLEQNEIPDSSLMKVRCDGWFQNVQPSLLHGDLWSGNYLISEDGIPYLIDPAVYYGDREVDLAMTQLFGGFDLPFYQAYHNTFPLESEANQRVELYQLYYLLVHLNLFGRSYYGSVSRLLKYYFS